MGAGLCRGRQGDFAPRVHGGVSQFAMFSSACPVAVKMEEVGDRAMNRDEARHCPTDLNRIAADAAAYRAEKAKSVLKQALQFERETKVPPTSSKPTWKISTSAKVN
jgi:hypothetical protein